MILEEIHYLEGVSSKIKTVWGKINEFHYDIERGIDFESYKERERDIVSLISDLVEELDLRN